GQVAQQRALAAGQAIEGDVLSERYRAFPHVAYDRLRRQVFLVQPWVRASVDRECATQQLGERLRITDVGEQFHPLVVVEAVRVHRRDRFPTCPVLLCGEHLPRVVQGRLEYRDDIEGVGLACRVEQFQGGERKRRQRLVESEVHRQIRGQPHRAAL